MIGYKIAEKNNLKTCTKNNMKDNSVTEIPRWENLFFKLL